VDASDDLRSASGSKPVTGEASVDASTVSDRGNDRPVRISDDLESIFGCHQQSRVLKNIITASVEAVILSGELESDMLVAFVDASNNLES